MSKNQLVTRDPSNRQLLEPQAPESTIIERFTEASREIVPSVEISLAKRIIRPGSNQIFCLAAHTSVPLNEDELASVSDLALRLSDGTNVRLSLSFFNDQGVGAIPTSGPQYIPLNRSIYDPNRYQLPDEPKLGLVLLATTIISLAGLWSVLKGPFGPWNWQPALQSIVAGSTKAMPKTVVTFPAAAALKARAAKSEGESAKSGSGKGAAREGSRSLQEIAGETETMSQSSKSKVTKAHHAKGEHLFVPPPPATPPLSGGRNMFVPPPPPMTYSLPAEQSLVPFDPLQGLAPVSARTKPGLSAKSGVNKVSPALPDSAPETDVNTQPAKKDKSAGPDAFNSSVSDIEKEQSPAAGDNAGSAAPLPGAASDYPALERIVMPN